MKILNKEVINNYNITMTTYELQIIIDCMCAVRNGRIKELNKEESDLLDVLIKESEKF